MVPFVRIPRCTPQLFNYALGAGAGGVVMPHVQNAKQAQELVRLCRFSPMGDRSFPPAALIGEQQNRTPEGKTTYDVWDEHAALICQIEDLDGLETLRRFAEYQVVGLFKRLLRDLSNNESPIPRNANNSPGLLQLTVCLSAQAICVCL